MEKGGARLIKTRTHGNMMIFEIIKNKSKKKVVVNVGVDQSKINISQNEKDDVITPDEYNAMFERQGNNSDPNDLTNIASLENSVDIKQTLRNAFLNIEQDDSQDYPVDNNRFNFGYVRKTNNQELEDNFYVVEGYFFLRKG